QSGLRHRVPAHLFQQPPHLCRRSKLLPSHHRPQMILQNVPRRLRILRRIIRILPRRALAPPDRTVHIRFQQNNPPLRHAVHAGLKRRHQPHPNLSQCHFPQSHPASNIACPTNTVSPRTPREELSFTPSQFHSFTLSQFHSFFPLCSLCSSLCDLCVTVPLLKNRSTEPNNIPPHPPQIAPPSPHTLSQTTPNTPRAFAPALHPAAHRPSFSIPPAPPANGSSPAPPPDRAPTPESPPPPAANPVPIPPAACPSASLGAAGSSSPRKNSRCTSARSLPAG